MQRVIAVFAETVVDVFGPNGQHQLTWSQDQIEDVTFTVLRIVINLSTVIHLGEEKYCQSMTAFASFLCTVLYRCYKIIV